MAKLLESLERRTLFALVTWDGGAGTSSWHTAANWSGDVVPTASDDVEINSSPFNGVEVTAHVHVKSLTVLRATVRSTQSVQLVVDERLYVGENAKLQSSIQAYLSIYGSGWLETATSARVVEDYYGSYLTGGIAFHVPVINRGSISCINDAYFEAGITNFGNVGVQVGGDGAVYGDFVNEAGGTLSIRDGASQTPIPPKVKAGLKNNVFPAAFINRGTVLCSWNSPHTGPSWEFFGNNNPYAGLTVYVDTNPVLGGEWKAGNHPIKFASLTGALQPLTTDSSFRFLEGTLKLENVNATLSGMATDTALSLFANSAATFASGRTALSLLRMQSSTRVSLGNGNRVLNVQDVEQSGSTHIDIGDGLLVHGNQPGYLRPGSSALPATTPPYAPFLSGTFAGQPITLEPNGNSHAVGYSTGAGLASHYPSRVFSGETFDDNDFIFFATLRGDVNFDRQVDFTDLLTLGQRYGQTTSRGYADGNFEGDVTDSGTVGFEDLLRLAQNYAALFAVAAKPRAAMRNADVIS